MSNSTNAAYESAAYDEYLESQRQELRQEGAEELRKDILNLLVPAREFASAEMCFAFDRAITYVKRATIK
jgi:hypothetical protein